MALVFLRYGVLRNRPYDTTNCCIPTNNTLHLSQAAAINSNRSDPHGTRAARVGTWDVALLRRRRTGHGGYVPTFCASAIVARGERVASTTPNQVIFHSSKHLQRLGRGEPGTSKAPGKAWSHARASPLSSREARLHRQQQPPQQQQASY